MNHPSFRAVFVSLAAAVCIAAALLWAFAGKAGRGTHAPWAHGYMAAAAHPLATDAAASMLARGGHAVDGAIAAHAVLGLVEPESSGLGGGGFMLVFQRPRQNTVARDERSLPGGGFLEALQEGGGALRFFDGREAAPAGARADMFMRNGETKGFFDAADSGAAVGAPGAVALYWRAHAAYGELPWADLFAPAIRLAEEGFAVPAKLARYLPAMARLSRLDENPGAAEYFYPDGEPLTAGRIIRNPEYADTLRRIAADGPAAFYAGDIAEAIAAAAQAAYTGDDGGTLTLADLAAYRALERPPRCGPWRGLQVCSAPAPGSGAMQIMVANLYDRLLPGSIGAGFDDGAGRGARLLAFDNDAGRGARLRAFVDAQRLAYADRDYYFGDPDFVAVPEEELLQPRYLDERARHPAPPGGAATWGNPSRFSREGAAGEPALGNSAAKESSPEKQGPNGQSPSGQSPSGQNSSGQNPSGQNPSGQNPNGKNFDARKSAPPFAEDSTDESPGTTHLSIVDNEGNAVAMTMTVESPFGSKRWAAGFVLNNQMTDFARDYDPSQPEPANMARPGARPRSSMSPTIVLDDAGRLLMLTGSPGGNSIPAYTAKTLLAVMDWQLSAQEAAAFPNIVARGAAVRVETGAEPGPAIAAELRAAGYDVRVRERGENSGLHIIVVRDDGLEGAADPRRAGTVLRGGGQ